MIETTAAQQIADYPLRRVKISPWLFPIGCRLPCGYTERGFAKTLKVVLMRGKLERGGGFQCSVVKMAADADGLRKAGMRVAALSVGTVVLCRIRHRCSAGPEVIPVGTDVPVRIALDRIARDASLGHDN